MIMLNYIKMLKYCLFCGCSKCKIFVKDVERREILWDISVRMLEEADLWGVPRNKNPDSSRKVQTLCGQSRYDFQIHIWDTFQSAFLCCVVSCCNYFIQLAGKGIVWAFVFSLVSFELSITNKLGIFKIIFNRSVYYQMYKFWIKTTFSIGIPLSGYITYGLICSFSRGQVLCVV